VEYVPYVPQEIDVRVPALFQVLVPAALLEPGEVVVLRGHFADRQWEWPFEQDGEVWSSIFDGLDGVSLGEHCPTGIFRYKYFIVNHGGGDQQLPEYEFAEGCNWRVITSYVNRYFNIFEPSPQLAVRNPQASNLTPAVTAYLKAQVLGLDFVANHVCLSD
jgi:hypothetical protein